MIPVLLESPYAGHVQRNKAYLQLCIRDCVERGETPFASHQMFTDALDDLNPEERRQGIEAGLVWGQFTKRSVFYIDFGMSEGMQKYGLTNAEKARRPVELRQLPGFDAEAFFTPTDALQDTPWQELLARALRRQRTLPVDGACIIVLRRGENGEPLVLGLEGPKGTGLPGGKIHAGEKPEVAAARELEEETGLALKPGVGLNPLLVRTTDNGDRAHGYWVHAADTFGELRDSPEGRPVWLRPADLAVDRVGMPPVRFPEYNSWALRSLHLHLRD